MALREGTSCVQRDLPERRGAARFWRGARGERQTQARTNLRLPARRVPVSVPTA